MTRHRLIALSLLAGALIVPLSGDTADPAVKININTSSDLHTEAFASGRFPILREAGFTEIYDGTVWSQAEAKKGRIDYARLDFVCAKAHASGIRVFLKIAARPPRWWWRENRSEIPRYDNGEPVLDPDDPKKPGSLADLSFASRKEMRDYAAFLKRFIRRMERQPYASAIAGYNVLENELGFARRTVVSGRTYRFTDYSPPMQAYFRAYLKSRFGGDLKAMNAALGTAFASFESVAPPPPRKDITAAEMRPLWLLFMEARKRAQQEFFNHAIRAARSVTSKPIAGSELASASAPPYAENYQEMASGWDHKFFVRGDYPKYYIDTLADYAPLNLYCENPALIHNVFSLARQYKKNLMVGEFNGFFRKYGKPLPERSRGTYRYGWGGVIPLEALVVYKHLFALHGVRPAYLHRLMYFVDPTHQPDAPMDVRRRTLREIARPFPFSLKKAAPQVLVDFTFEDVNAAPAAFHRNIDHYGKMLASLGVSYVYGNSRDLAPSALDTVPVVLVPADSVLDNDAALAAHARRGRNVILFGNAWTQEFRSLRRDRSWIRRNLGTIEEKPGGILRMTTDWGDFATGESLAVRRYVRFPQLSRGAQVLARDADGKAVIVRVGNVTVCGVDPGPLATIATLGDNFRLLRGLLAVGGVRPFVQKPNPYVSLLPLANGWYAYSPTAFGPESYPLAFPARGGFGHYRLITHDAEGVEVVGPWTPGTGDAVSYNLRPGTNLIVEMR